MTRRATTALRRRSGLRSFSASSLSIAFSSSASARSFLRRAFLLQLSQPFGLLGLHAAVLLLPAVVVRLGHLNGAADVGDGLALGDQLLSGLELADDLLGCVADAFHGGVPGPVWPDEDSFTMDRSPGSTLGEVISG